MDRIKLIRQQDDKDCGTACFAMICNFYGKKVPTAVIRHKIGTDRNGANFYGILNTAKEYGMDALALEGTVEELIEVINNKEILLPCIARIVNRNQYEHYVVIYKIMKDKIYIADPDLGKIKMSTKDFSQIWLGQIATFRTNKEFRKEHNDKSNFRKYFSLIMCQPTLLFMVFFLSLIISGIGILGTFIFQYIIDNVLNQNILLNEHLKVMDTFPMICIAIIFLYITKAIFGVFRGKLLMMLSKNIDLPLMLGYYEHMIHLPMNVLSTYKTGEILSRFGDTSKIRDAISNITLTLMMDTVMACVCGCVLYYQSSTLFFIVIIILTVYTIIHFIFKPLMKKSQISIMSEEAQLNSFMKETVDGIQTIKAYSIEDKVKELTQTKLTHYINSSISANLLELIQDNLIELVSSIGSLLLLWIGTKFIVQQEMTLGILITFSSLLGYFITPVQNILDLQSDIQSAMIAMERLANIVDCERENNKGDSFQNGMIEFKNLDFRYGYRKLVLEDINFSIPLGSKVAIVGKSGCGKTTIANLLMKFYPIEKGYISINGKNIEEMSTQDLRKHISYITQNTFFFSDTIKNNLIMGLENISDEYIGYILELCGCQSFIEKLPLGINTMLEENGANLSGGQCQRLAIARALLHSPDIIILDEATSQLDAVAEMDIRDMLVKYFPKVTCIMIAHRLSFIKNCDKILLFEDGKLVEEGIHEDLLNSKGKYFDLWKAQHS